MKHEQRARSFAPARRVPRTLARAALAAALLAAPLQATWSICLVNTKTHEVAVGCATCLTSDIQNAVPVLVPEHGAAASQSALDVSGINRKAMYRGLLADAPPAQILSALQQINGVQTRQFGIVNLFDAPVTFTGNLAAAAKGGVAGVAGDLRYAIQGNILTGPEVWLAAETALINTPGDLGQKLMAAMEAARSFGGDGRCSCDPAAPTSCGAPPVNGFQKSAHTAFVGLARVGDVLGTCTSGGCANGSYYLSLDFTGGVSDPDPVLMVQAQYDAWRAALSGRPDQLLSAVLPSGSTLLSDGVDSLRVHVALVDVDGVPLTSGGASLAVVPVGGAAPVTTPSAVIDHGDGTYTFSIRAGTSAGTDSWRVVATDAVGPVVLQPDVSVTVAP